MNHRFRGKQRFRPGRRPGLSRLRVGRGYPFIRLGLILLGVVAVTLAVIFVVIPALNPPEQSDLDNIDSHFQDPLEGQAAQQKENDLSALQVEAAIPYNTINDAYMCGDEILFSSSSVKNGLPVYNKLVVFNTAEDKSEEISDIRVKYENIIWCRLTRDYLVWLDSHSDGGGRIMMYDRAAKKSYLIKEYAYALPQLSVSGDHLAFMQQAGDSLDRLYLFNLRTREGVAVKVFSDLLAPTGAVHMSAAGLTYSVPYMDQEIQKCRIYVQPVDGGAEEVYEVGRYAYSPKMNGDHIAFLSSINGPPRDIYLFEKGGAPERIETDVVNFDMGEGFLAYTKGNSIYIYMFATGQKYRLNTEMSRGMLSSVCGDTVCWYDVTGGPADVDVVKYAKVAGEKNG